MPGTRLPTICASERIRKAGRALTPCSLRKVCISLFAHAKKTNGENPIDVRITWAVTIREPKQEIPLQPMKKVTVCPNRGAEDDMANIFCEYCGSE